MAAVAILELLRKNPNFGGQAFNSRGLFSQKLVGAATASAASLAVTVPFAFGDGETQHAYCDAGGRDYTSNYQTISRNLYRKDALTYSYSTKRYYIQLKSIFSVFYWENLALISLRSFLRFYLPLLKPRSLVKFFRPGKTHESRIDLVVVPFKKSVEQIIYETTVVTTTRVLERIVVHYVSRRAAWKLLKDVPMSAIRKSRRRLPLSTYIFNVGKTTFRGHIIIYFLTLTSICYIVFYFLHYCFFYWYKMYINEDIELEQHNNFEFLQSGFSEPRSGVVQRSFSLLLVAGLEQQ